MKYLSLFSGIGGFELGIENSNKELECVGYAEIDKYADSIYRRHFPKHKGLGDVTRIRTEELEDFDLLVGGFPCQSFSIAGYQRGFDDTRGTLFFEIARILKDKRPKYFLLENVRNLLSHNKGETFKTILEVLSNIGYDVSWQIYNSKNYGVPQNRERIYLKGHFRERCGGEILSFTNTSEETNEKVTQLNNHRKTYQDGRIYDSNGLSITLNSRGNNGFYTDNAAKIELIKYGNQGSRIYDSKGLATCLNSGGSTENYKVNVLDDGHFTTIDNEKGITTTNGDCFCVNTRPRQMPLKKKIDNYVKDDYRVRRLTPLECERLQAFPDNWTQYGADGEKISDTQRYKCCGNAVTTTVVTAIMNDWDLKNGV